MLPSGHTHTIRLRVHSHFAQFCAMPKHDCPLSPLPHFPARLLLAHIITLRKHDYNFIGFVAFWSLFVQNTTSSHLQIYWWCNLAIEWQQEMMEAFSYINIGIVYACFRLYNSNCDVLKYPFTTLPGPRQHAMLKRDTEHLHLPIDLEIIIICESGVLGHDYGWSSVSLPWSKDITLTNMAWMNVQRHCKNNAS